MEHLCPLAEREVGLGDEGLLTDEEVNVLGGELAESPRLDLHSEHCRTKSQLEKLRDGGGRLANDSSDCVDTDDGVLVVEVLDGTEAEEEVEEGLVLGERELDDAGHGTGTGERPTVRRGWHRGDFSFHSTSERERGFGEFVLSQFDVHTIDAHAIPKTPLSVRSEVENNITSDRRPRPAPPPQDLYLMPSASKLPLT